MGPSLRNIQQQIRTFLSYSKGSDGWNTGAIELNVAIGQGIETTSIHRANTIAPWPHVRMAMHGDLWRPIPATTCHPLISSFFWCQNLISQFLIFKFIFQNFNFQIIFKILIFKLFFLKKKKHLKFQI